jgi:hypothetical protein
MPILTNQKLFSGNFSESLKRKIHFIQSHSSLRIHGENKRSDSEALARDNLITGFISNLTQGPHLYGIFDLGRIEQYFPVNNKTLKAGKFYNDN